MPHDRPLRPLLWTEIPEASNWKVSVKNDSVSYHCALPPPTLAQSVVKPETCDIHFGMAHHDQYSSWFL